MTMTYSDVNVPDDCPVENLTTMQRRAEILEAIAKAGTPEAVNQTTLAERFGVHQSTISRDIDAIRDDIAESIGREGYEITLSVAIPAGEADVSR